MNYAITFAILGTAAAVIVVREYRRYGQSGGITPLSRVLAQHDREEQSRRDPGSDTLDALIEATCEWPPEAEQPIPYELAPWDEWEREMAEGSGL